MTGQSERRIIAGLTRELHAAQQEILKSKQTFKDASALFAMLRDLPPPPDPSPSEALIDQQADAIRASGLFDADWYLRAYPDVKSAGIDPARHYAVSGRFEGRAPNSGQAALARADTVIHTYRAEIEASGLFDRDWYLDRYPMVATSGFDPVDHYLRFGAALRLDPSPGFSAEAYHTCYPELQAATISPLLHYIRYGHLEGRWTISVDRGVALAPSAPPSRPTPAPRRPGRPPRVLFVSHNLQIDEGAPISLFDLAKGLRDRGYVDPVVFALRPGPLAARYEAAGIPCVTAAPAAPLMAGAVPLLDFHRTEAGLFECLTDPELDAVITNTTLCLWCAHSAQQAGLPSLAILRESSEAHIRFATLPEWLRPAARDGLHQADQVVFVAQDTRRLWQEGYPDRGSVLIPNGITLGDAGQTGDMRQQLGLGPQDLLFVTIGTLSARKAQMDIVQAFCMLPDLPGVHLAIIGANQAEYSTFVADRIAAQPASVRERVHLLPATDTPAPWYRAADVFLFASRNESYPRTIIEAMSFGLPIISSDLPGIREQVEPDRSALLFPAGDIQALSTAMTALTQNQDQRQALGKAALEQYHKLTSYDQMLTLYQAEIDSMLTHREQTGPV